MDQSLMTPGRYGVVMATRCAVHRHRELVPIHRHHVHPQALGGSDDRSNLVELCANAHYSVHALLDLMLKAPRVRASRDDPWRPLVPWRVRRRYGWRVRRIAEAGYAAVAAARDAARP